MQKAYPVHFPDHESLAADRLQRALLVSMDECLRPDDPSLEARRKGVFAEAVEAAKPPLMTGPGNVPDAIREAYIDWLTLLQFEGLPADHTTPSMDFWRMASGLERKFRANKHNHATEPL